jgi:hypothetical protein
MAKNTPFVAEIKTISGDEHSIYFTAYNLIDAVNKLTSGGFLISENGTLIMTNSIESFNVEKLNENNIKLFEKFKDLNIDLLTDLRLHDSI